jgi:gliding motility-associated-like protein
MMLYKVFLAGVLLLFVSALKAQPVCSWPGQTPAAALSICGNNTYSQSPLPNCFNKSFFVSGCTNQNTSYGDVNPVYYSFTCVTGGSFAFVVMPWKPSDDYNWQLFDITGKLPNDIYSDKTTSIAGNWSGTLGPTGASSAGTGITQCRSFAFDNKNPFSIMPLLIAGHTYLLMISGLDASGSYALTIGGGTADITNNTNQSVSASISSCNNNEVVLSLSKRISCSSISADGSDFSISPASASIVSVTGIGCNPGQETDSIRILFSNPLPNGSYTLSIINGTDNNTLSDACRNFITAGTQFQLNVSAFVSVDSIVTECKPNQLKLILTKKVLCNSVAADGSDFVITGPQAVTVSSASSNCKNGITDTVTLFLQQAISVGGNYLVTINTGTDGNTFSSSCNDVTPAGSFYNFKLKDTVNANFSFTIKQGCIADTVLYEHPGGNDINSWIWDFETGTSTQQQPVILYTNSGNQTTTLTVSNGVCSDKVQKQFTLKPKMKVDFTFSDTSCANEPVGFTNNTSLADSWFWNFSNGVTSTIQHPEPQVYPASLTDKNYSVTLTGTNANCSITVSKTIHIKSNCNVQLPSAFTPNGDGLNDYFGPLNISSLKNISFKVFNRYGQTVFIYSPANTKWDGNFNGVLQPVGEYIWMLSYINSSTGGIINRKGSVTLIR